MVVSNCSPRLVSEDEREGQIARARTLKQLNISSREAGDLVMMGIGGFTPIEGFMGHDDWRGVSEEMRLSTGCSGRYRLLCRPTPTARRP